MHIAFFGIPAHGHVTPTLGLVETLVARGHRVGCVTTAEFAPVVEPVGAYAVTYPSTWPVPAALPSPTTFEAAARIRRMLLDESLGYAPVAETAFAADPPDVLVYDTSVGPIVRILARAWGTPAVQLFTGVAASGGYSLASDLVGRYPALAYPGDHPGPAELRGRIAAFAAAHGVEDPDPDDLARPAEAASLILQPREFQARADTFDDRYAFVGPCPDSRRAGASYRPADPDAPLLLVSLGTLYNDWPAFFRMCADAFADTRWRVVMAVGERVDRTRLGPLPDNVEAHAYVPQLAILRCANCFVSHAGMGGTMEALAQAVPIVAVPQTPEQDAVARRIAELGLGRRLPPDSVGPELLYEAVSETALSSAVAGRLRTMQAAVRTAGGADAAAAVIEAHGAGAWPTGPPAHRRLSASGPQSSRSRPASL